MAQTDVYPGDYLNGVKEQLQPFVAALGEKESLRASGVAESFQVWTVSLKDFRESGAAKAKWNGVWHHQLRRAGAPAEAFARSLAGGVRAVYRSPLALEIDHVIDSIDRDPALRDDAYRVRLLEIPDLHLTTVWISSEDTNQYIPLSPIVSSDDELSDNGPLLKAEAVTEGQELNPIGEMDLIERLPQKPVTGISETPPPNRRTDFLEEDGAPTP